MLAVLVAVLFGLAPTASLPPPSPPAVLSEAASSTVRDSLTYYYARQDTSAIERLYRTRARTREDRLLCLYRLFPMTNDRSYLGDIPSEDGVTSARELALISALWAYRAASGPAWRLPSDGMRSERILERALERDAREPYALLVQGQGLLYKPGIFGGDVPEAQRTFERLRARLGGRGVPGLHPFEAEIWIWMAVREQNARQGRALQQRLLQRSPPRIFRQFLVDPP